jgi:hypothetical protein
MAKIKYTIECSWTISSHDGEIEVDDEDLEGLSDDDRERMIGQMVEEDVANYVSWGWEEQG